MDKEYVYCPHCGKKLFRIEDNSHYKNLYIWCKKCNKEIKVNEPKSRTLKKV